jgi:hypothetical protein
LKLDGVAADGRSALMKRTAGVLLLLVALHGCAEVDYPPNNSARQPTQPCCQCGQGLYGGDFSTGNPRVPAAVPRPNAPTRLPDPSANLGTQGMPNSYGLSNPRPLSAGGASRADAMAAGATPTTAYLAGRPRLPSPADDLQEDADPADNPAPAPVADARPGRRPAKPAADETVEQEDAAPALPATSYVNTKRILINYEVKDTAAAGLGRVELWCTQNGGAWQHYGVSAQQRTPYVVEVPGEGTYGFTLVAYNEAGHGVTPQPDDLPQVSVVVDQTKPVVRLLGARTESNDPHGLVILWKATDANLGPHPICLSWARTAAGPWQPITSDLDNTGRYVWKMPTGLPSSFHVRVEAADLAGNVGSAQTPMPVVVQAVPSIAIHTVEPNNRTLQPKVSVMGVQPVRE